MASRPEIVDFFGFYILHDMIQIGRVSQVTTVQNEAPSFFMRFFVQMINAVGINRRSPAFDAMEFMALN